ncbi:hypothetical protein [Cypionkella sp.]|uniref:hypothetical protein n=1 Tax=Cypionkella sp. TaxID=2811411 RepID=UPI0027156E3A|nr:hypothetical protein [Cypionkella sp.]MDO8985560.1 hypothetical protein [Cypionkella sp.]MDP2048775.1 hypothetical protein [Cypionkella sp.]
MGTENARPMIQETNTITICMNQKEFNSFLHEAHGNPMADGGMWKRPTISVEPEIGAFHLIEFFTESLIGPIVAMHETHSYAALQVTFWKPGEGIYRTVADLMAERRGGAQVVA